MRQLRRLAPLLTAVLAVLAGSLTLTACGSDSEPPASSQGAKSIDITFEGNTVTPNGERVEVAIGQPVKLVVTADAPGEIHVHSDPEQELEYKEGTTTVTIQGIDQPGTVDVESHTLDKVIVQLEVR
jgi:hypothetical protein